MDLITLVTSIAGISALVLQGVSSLKSDDRQTAVGVIDLLLATIAIFGVYAMTSGSLVLATDFGAVMVQGVWTARLVRAALAASALVPALCWCRVREINKWSSRPKTMIGCGALLGIWAAAQLHVLNPAYPADLHVYFYDVWWPPLIIWFIVCFSGVVLAIIESTQFLEWIWAASALTTVTAAAVLRYETLADRQPDSVWPFVWLVIERASWFVAVASAGWQLARDSQSSRKALMIVAGVAIAAGAAFAFVPMGSAVRMTIGAIPLAVLILGMIIAIVEQVRGGPAPAGDVATPATEDAHGAADHLRVAIKVVSRVMPRESRTHAVALAISLPATAAAVVDLSTIGWLPRWIDVAIVIGFWILLAERLGDEALRNLSLRALLSFSAVKVIKDTAQAVGRTVKAAGGAVLGFFKTEEGKGKGLILGMKAVFATIVVLVALVTANELLTTRSIVIKQFQWAGADDDKSKDDKAKAQALSSVLINALGCLRNDLRTDLMTAGHRSSGERSTDARLLAAGDSSSLETAVAKSEEIQISGVKLPVQFLVAPIENAVRALMGVRVIQGTVWKTGDRAVVAANSSGGESWRLEEEPAASSTATGVEVCAVPTLDTRTELVEHLAFDIASSDPVFVDVGLTRNYRSFLYYRQGLRLWNDYESENDWASLQAAIACFREAANRDVRFAPAHYRLGIALQRDGQPRSAIEAFRASYSDGTPFVAGALQEAATLYYFGDYYSSQAAILPPAATFDRLRSSRFGPGDGDVKPQRRIEAQLGWIRIASLPARAASRVERRAAYFGLCRFETDNVLWSVEQVDLRLPYFFCSRAEALWPWISSESAEGEKAVEASVMTYLGIAMSKHRSTTRMAPAGQFPNRWTCAESSLDINHLDATKHPTHFLVPVSRRLRRAAGYYRRSLALVPGDAYVRCLLATAVISFDGDIREMQTLYDQPAAHLTEGYDLLADANSDVHDNGDDPSSNATWHYRRALFEFETAVGLDPGSVEALNAYGYSVWQWKLDAIDGLADEPPDDPMLVKAERYARESARLAQVWHMVDAELAARGTVGELLVAQGRTGEALDELNALLNRPLGWVGRDEVRWDLAQAQLCAARRTSNRTAARELREAARREYEKIETDEQSRDRRPFTEGAPGALDTVLRETRCSAPPDQPSPRFPFVARKPVYSTGATCTWVSVTAKAEGRHAPKTTYQLHVWGGSLDEQVEAGPESLRAIAIATPFKAQRYYAQLEDKDGKPVSSAVAIDPRPDSSPGNCQTRLTLTFEAVTED
jgi:hypothetical protein